MSADVWIGEDSFNYTHNVSKLFYDHIPDEGKGGGLRELEGLTGKQACAVLKSFFEKVSRTKMRLWKSESIGEPEFCSLYDAKNGWGSTVGALLFMSQILAACAVNPRKRVGISL